jgi:hypothetical protein
MAKAYWMHRSLIMTLGNLQNKRSEVPRFAPRADATLFEVRRAKTLKEGMDLRNSLLSSTAS